MAMKECFAAAGVAVTTGFVACSIVYAEASTAQTGVGRYSSAKGSSGTGRGEAGSRAPGSGLSADSLGFSGFRGASACACGTALPIPYSRPSAAAFARPRPRPPFVSLRRIYLSSKGS